MELETNADKISSYLHMKSQENWDSDGEEDKPEEPRNFQPLVYQCLRRRTIQINQTNHFGLPQNEKEFRQILYQIFTNYSLDLIHDRLRITRGYIVSIVLTTCDFLENIYENENLILYKSPVMEEIAEEVLFISWKIHKYSDIFKVADTNDIMCNRDSDIMPVYSYIAQVPEGRLKDEISVTNSFGEPQNKKELREVLRKIYLTPDLTDVHERLRDTSALLDGIIGTMKEFIENIEENRGDLLIYQYMEIFRKEAWQHYADIYALSKIFKDNIPENTEV